MQSPRYVAKYGAIRFLSCPGRAAIVSKFRAVSGTACKMPSPTPPKSAKVELSGYVEFWLRFIGVKEVVTLTLEHTWDGRAVDMIDAGKKKAAELAKQF